MWLVIVGFIVSFIMAAGIGANDGECWVRNNVDLTSM